MCQRGLLISLVIESTETIDSVESRRFRGGVVVVVVVFHQKSMSEEVVFREIDGFCC